MQMLCIVPDGRAITTEGTTARRRIGNTAGRAECAVAAATSAYSSGVGAHAQAQLLVATERIGHGIVQQRTTGSGGGGGLLITLDGIVTLQFQRARLRGRTIQVRRIDILQGKKGKVKKHVNSSCNAFHMCAVFCVLCAQHSLHTYIIHGFMIRSVAAGRGCSSYSAGHK